MAKILIVEDYELNRDLLSRLLTRRGFEVILAVDGQEALDRVAVEHPDLVIMDLDLPKIDGLMATRILKANPASSTIPILVLTAAGMGDEQRQCREAGCDDYDAKPVEIDRLVNKIRMLLERKENV